MPHHFAPAVGVLLALTASSLAGTQAEPSAPSFEVDPYAPACGRIFEVVPGKNSPWSFTIEPYLWAVGMAGDVGVKGFPATHVDFSSKTVLQNLDWGVMGKAEARYGRWGLLGDGMFAQLSADADPPGPLYKGASMTIQQGLAQLALAYRVWEDYRGYVDIYAGARYNYLGINLGADQDTSGIEQVGNNASQRISDRLGLAADKLVNAARTEVASRLNARIDAAKRAATGRLDALQTKIEQAIREGKTVDIERLQALQGRIATALKDKVANGLARINAIKAQVSGEITNGIDKAKAAKAQLSEDMRRQLDAGIDERLADASQEIAGLERQREFRKAFQPIRSEFEDLVRARVQREVAVAKVQVARDLGVRLVTAARERVDAALKLRALIDRRRGSSVKQEEIRRLAARTFSATPGNRASAQKLVAASRAQLAAAQSQLAAVKNADTAALDRQVRKAEKKLAKAISNTIEDTLPTSGSGDRWWVDPIVGIRAQINVTRWLYLATQCDVGGFAAGSQIAWNLNGSIGVNWTRSFFTEIGYRYYYVDYVKTGFTYQVAESGILLGCGVKF